MPAGQTRWRPSSAWSPLVTSMITAGSVRGKCSALHEASVQRRTWPAASGRVGAPHAPQCLCRACQCMMPRA